MKITDRLRFTIIQVNTNTIVSRDLVVKEPEVMINLSSPSRCMFKIPQGEQYNSSFGIDWKTWGYWIVPEIEIDGVRKCLGAQIVSKCDVDYQSGDMVIEGLGFMGYPKGIPWLADYNPIAVDPAEVIQKIWADAQNYTNANLGVQVLPALVGAQMLPGYSFDGSVFSFDFYALFVRQVDFNDSGDFITSLCRDLPMDMLEEVSWNAGRTSLTKTIRLGYPQLGLDQQFLSFVLGENVITAECAEELEVEPVSDVIIRSYMPGRTKTYQLNLQTENTTIANAANEAKQTAIDDWLALYPGDIEGSVNAGNLAFAELNYGNPLADPMARVRRVIMEEDANIDSTERAAAWARRKLTRRNIPKSFSKITIDVSHPNAPLGSFWVGDTIYVKAKNYPWRGDIEGPHRVTSITFKNDAPTADIGLKVEGAFNYDSIYYDPNFINQPTTDTNKLANGYFDDELAGWTKNSGAWIRTSNDGYTSPNCVYVLLNKNLDPPFGNGLGIYKALESHKVSINPGQTLNFSAWVKTESVTTDTGIDTNIDGIYITYKRYKNGGIVGTNTGVRLAGRATVAGTNTWTKLQGTYTAPLDMSVNEVSIVLSASKCTDGKMYWDDVRIEP